MRRWLVAGLGLAAAVPTAAVTQVPDSALVHAAIDSVVRAQLARDWGVEPSQVYVDFGLMPDPADAPTVAEIKSSGRNGRLLITFALMSGSRTASAARAGTVQQVPIATGLLFPGDTLTAEAIGWADARIPGPPVALSAGPRPGDLVRSRIVAGQRLTSAVVQPPPAVRVGSLIGLIWGEHPVTLELEGLALGTGYVGDTIPVRLRGNGDRVMARIIGPGTAQLRERRR